MEPTDDFLGRTRLLLGDEAMRRVENCKVIIFGVGGVGSWCAECLVRSGVKHLTIVDSDVVCPTNVNRQIMATSQTLGQIKVAAMRDRLLAIAPDAQIEAIREIYSAETADNFALDEYDYIVDAIDSLKDKALLILRATASKATLVSSMGAALKMDASQIKVVEFWDAKGCPLARALRKRFKRDGVRPSRKFKCVFSPELLENKNPDAAVENGKSVNGTLMHITAIFGLTIASEIIRQLYSGPKQTQNINSAL